jgi:hypothetical protein
MSKSVDVIGIEVDLNSVVSRLHHVAQSLREDGFDAASDVARETAGHIRYLRGRGDVGIEPLTRTEAADLARRSRESIVDLASHNWHAEAFILTLGTDAVEALSRTMRTATAA